LAIKEIVGASVTVFVIIYMLWFVIPVSKTSYNNELSHLNTTSSLMQQILPITNNWWVIFPLLIVIVGGYTIWQYATNRLAGDY
jgi:type II secretory pathway component PulF